MFIIEYIIHRFKSFLYGDHSNRNLDKAQRHAILALAYWKDCKDEMERGNHVYKLEDTDIFIMLGRGIIEEKKND
jgi:hypothetical protein